MKQKDAGKLKYANYALKTATVASQGYIETHTHTYVHISITISAYFLPSFHPSCLSFELLTYAMCINLNRDDVDMSRLKTFAEIISSKCWKNIKIIKKRFLKKK